MGHFNWPLTTSTAQVVSDAGRVVAQLARISRACNVGSSEGLICATDQSFGQRENPILLTVSPCVLLADHFVDFVSRCCNDLGAFTLYLAFEAKDLRDLSSLRKFRCALYALSDHGVQIVLKNPAVPKERSKYELIIERAVSTFSVTPQWLGIGAMSGEFDQSKYLERVTRLSSAIHDQDKAIFYESVDGDWHRSFVNALPIKLFVPSYSKDDVYV